MHFIHLYQKQLNLFYDPNVYIKSVLEVDTNGSSICVKYYISYYMDVLSGSYTFNNFY